MKRTLLLSVFVLSVAHAQNFSPTTSNSSSTIGTPSGASGTLGSPSAMGNESFNAPATGAAQGSTVPGLGATPGAANTNTNINSTNTAPTSIPQDTTLLNTPSGNPVRQQSQEEFNTFPDSTTSPGTGTGTTPSTGTGTNLDRSSPSPLSP